MRMLSVKHTNYGIKDFTGSPDTSLKIIKGSLKISRNFSDWNSHILGSTCEFDIHNNKNDFFELFDLLYATERKYRITVTDTYDMVILFSGYINTEVTQQKYLKYQPIKIVASSFLSKLEYTSPDTIIEDIDVYSYIDIIDACLVSIGTNYNILVNVAGVPEEDTLDAGQSALNVTGHVSEAFWKDNVERLSSEEIVSSILKIFNCYLYWWDGKWYIEEYHLFWNTNKEFIEYTTGQSYGFEDAGVVRPETVVINDFHSYFKFIGRTQTIFVEPGNKINEIQLEDKIWRNLVPPDFRTPTKTHSTIPIPRYRHWMHYDEAGVYEIEVKNTSYGDIANSVKRTHTLPPDNATSIACNGLYYTFDVCMLELDEGKTNLTIKWKWAVDMDIVDSHEEIFARGRFYLKDALQDNFIVYDKANDEWKWVYGGGNMPCDENNIIDVSLLKDSTGLSNYKAGDVVEFTQTIPLNDVLGTGMEWRLVLGILETSFTVVNFNDYFPQEVYLGDVEVTSDGEKAFENNFEGSIVTDFLKKDSVSYDIFDIPFCNYINSIIRYSSQIEIKRTNKWKHPDMPYNPNMGVQTPEPLHIIRLVGITRQTNQSRQKITSDVLEPSSLLRPLMLFTDSLQSDKKFVLVAFEHNVDSGTYKVELREYDNETPIILDIYD